MTSAQGLEREVNILILENPMMTTKDCKRRDAIVRRIMDVEQQKTEGVRFNELNGVKTDDLHLVDYVVVALNGRYEGYTLGFAQSALVKLQDYVRGEYIVGQTTPIIEQ